MNTSHLKNNELTVVIAADKNFSVPLGIAVLSLLKTALPSTIYDIYVLDDNVQKEVKQQIEKLKATYCFNITYLNVSDVINNVPVSILFPKVAFARFLIPQILPHKKIVLYSDADVLFREDLTELFNIAMDGKAVAACPDINLARKNQRQYFSVFEEEYGIQFYKNSDFYFHSGFLLFNCELWNAGNFTKKIFDLARSNFSKKILYYDQDFMNIACFGHIKKISSRYCCVPLFENYYYSNYDAYYGDIINFETADELKKAYEKPAIIHYAGNKPIIFRKPAFKNEEPFFNFWMLSPWNNRIPYFPKEVLRFKQKNNINSDCLPKVSTEPKAVTAVIFTDNIIRQKQADKFILTIESIFKQQSDLFEILVIDNNSSDGTLDLLNKYKENNILRYISTECTIHEAYKYGLNKSSSTYIHFLELGDIINNNNFYKHSLEAENLNSSAILLRRDVISLINKRNIHKNKENIFFDIYSIIKLLKHSIIQDEQSSTKCNIIDVLLVHYYRKIQFQYYCARIKKLFKFGIKRKQQKEKIKKLKLLLKQSKIARKKYNLQYLFNTLSNSLL